jgi:hypothetical protein
MLTSDKRLFVRGSRRERRIQTGAFAKSTPHVFKLMYQSMTSGKPHRCFGVYQSESIQILDARRG